MTKSTYIKITEPLRQNPKLAALLQFFNRLFTGFAYILYPLFVLLLFLQKNPFFLRALLVPAISFAAVSIFRDRYNAPRPYEKFEIPPVLKKDTKGHSFPSRHVFSIFVIATTIFYVYPPVGILLFVLGAGLALIRVFGGVHEPRDVIAGAFIGIVCGVLGCYII